MNRWPAKTTTVPHTQGVSSRPSSTLTAAPMKSTAPCGDTSRSYRRRSSTGGAPLASAGYREYWDKGFLECLNLQHHASSLKSFWPPGGPHWDALAVVQRPGDIRPGVLLAEGRAIPMSSLNSRFQSSIDVSRVYVRPGNENHPAQARLRRFRYGLAPAISSTRLKLLGSAESDTPRPRDGFRRKPLIRVRSSWRRVRWECADSPNFAAARPTTVSIGPAVGKRFSGPRFTTGQCGESSNAVSLTRRSKRRSWRSRSRHVAAGAPGSSRRGAARWTSRRATRDPAPGGADLPAQDRG